MSKRYRFDRAVHSRKKVGVVYATYHTLKAGVSPTESMWSLPEVVIDMNHRSSANSYHAAAVVGLHPTPLSMFRRSGTGHGGAPGSRGRLVERPVVSSPLA